MERWIWVIENGMFSFWSSLLAHEMLGCFLLSLLSSVSGVSLEPLLRDPVMHLSPAPFEASLSDPLPVLALKLRLPKLLEQVNPLKPKPP